MIWDALKSNVIGPASTRVGTLVTGMLLGGGIAPEHADPIGLGVAAAFFVGFDFMAAWLRKRHIKKSAVEEAINGFDHFGGR